MKLFELVGVKGQKDKDLLQLIKDLDEVKFKKAGEGAAAQVFEVNGMIYKFWAKDSAYEKFIEFVEKNQDNPHLPKLKSKVKEIRTFFKKPQGFPDTIKYVKMEKLDPITYHEKIHGTKNVFIVDIIKEIYYSIDHKSEFREVESLAKEAEGSKLSDQSLKEIKGLYDTFVQMYDKIPGINKMLVDLHAGNMMKRGNTIVITDPLIDTKDLEFNETMARQLKTLHREQNADE